MLSFFGITERVSKPSVPGDTSRLVLMIVNLLSGGAGIGRTVGLDGVLVEWGFGLNGVCNCPIKD